MRSNLRGKTPASPSTPASPATSAEQVRLVVESALSEVADAADASNAASANAAGSDAGSGELVRATVRQCRELLASPPTFLVSGRMKAGKSTLINALVRQRIAETAILECTNATTVYAKGAPERIEDILVSPRAVGSRPMQPAEKQVAIPGEQPGEGPEDSARRVAKVHYIPSAALARASYIDTPGLGTIDAANRSVIDNLQKLTRVPWGAAGVGIDGVIYVFDSALRDDERAHLSSLGFPPLASVGVLSRADDFGAGAFGSTDPTEAARKRADELSVVYSGVFSTVVPVSGLLAESVETGVIKEQLAAELGALRRLDREVLMHQLETDNPTELGEASRERLLRALGAYGVLNGREAAAAGAVSLKAFLSQASGIAGLSETLEDGVHFVVLLGRAGQIHEKLRQLSLAAGDTRFLDIWDQAVPASLQQAVELYSLVRQAPGTRTSADSLTLAERALTLAGHRLVAEQGVYQERGAAASQQSAPVRLTAAEISSLAEIDAAASEKLLRLVSPLEEKILTAVRSLVVLLSH